MEKPMAEADEMEPMFDIDGERLYVGDVVRVARFPKARDAGDRVILSQWPHRRVFLNCGLMAAADDVRFVRAGE